MTANSNGLTAPEQSKSAIPAPPPPPPPTPFLGLPGRPVGCMHLGSVVWYHAADPARNHCVRHACLLVTLDDMAGLQISQHLWGWG